MGGKNYEKILIVEFPAEPFSLIVAPLAWVPWVPENPSIFEQWVPEPINFGKKVQILPSFLFIAV